MTHANLRAAVAVALLAAHRVREMGREGHDLPVTALGHVADSLDRGEDVAATLLRGYWGELMAFEPTRPTEMVGADDATRAAITHMARAARWAAAYFTWAKGPGLYGVKIATRHVVGEAGLALVACGWSHADAWAEVMQLYEGAGGEVCW